MSAPLWCLLVGLVVAAGAVPVARWLRWVTYRKPDEEDLPLPGSRWWVVPVLGGVGALLTWRVWFAPSADALGTVLDPGADAASGTWVRLVLHATLLVTALACTCLAAMDLDVHRLPDRIMWPTMGSLLIGLTAAAVIGTEWSVLLRVVLAGLACGGAYLLVALLSLARGSLALGLGDVKLAAVLGMGLGWFGWSTVLVGMYAGVLVGGAWALVLVLARRLSLRGDLAYGPPMMLGALLGLVVAPGALSELF